MAGNKKPRKPYKRPAYVTKLPVVFATPDDVANPLAAVPFLSLDMLATGKGESGHVSDIVHAIMLAQELRAHYETSLAAGEVIADGLVACRRIYERNARSGAWGLSGDELAVLREAVTLSDQMVKGCTRRQVRDAACVVAIKAEAMSK